MMPPHVRAVMAEPMRPLLGNLILRERARCAEMLRVGVAYHRSRLASVEGLIDAAALTGNTVEASKLGIQRIAIAETIKSMEVAVRAVGVPPGTCQKCGGAKVVPGGVVLAGGQPTMLPCPACASTPAAPPAAAPANGEPGRG
jgi:hypothetical protein